MIHRFDLQADAQALATWAEVSMDAVEPLHQPSSGSSPRLSPVLRISRSHERQIVWMREGLIPSYACDDHEAEQRAEAHAEAMTCNSCFRSAFRRRRCIVPAQILHEVRHLSPGVVHPCSFSLESGGIFGIAGIWETWVNDQQHAIESFAIVTVLVTPLLRTLFERMPVILQSREQQERWLRIDDRETPLDLLQPLSPFTLRDWKMTPDAVKIHLDTAADEDLAHQTA